MLEVQGIETRYGSSQVLFGIDLKIADGEVVTLLGRNGMGKTTTIRSIMGLTPPEKGAIFFDGKETTHLPSYHIARLGIGLVPEGRQIFPNLTVYENLIATSANRRKLSTPWNPDRIFAMFPSLAARRKNRGNQLSGGEQQMLAISRALMTNPRLLILDEATEGLAPLIRKEIWRCLESLKQNNQSILVIDKNLEPLLRIANRHYIIEKGRTVWSGPSEELTQTPNLQHRYLGV